MHLLATTLLLLVTAGCAHDTARSSDAVPSPAPSPSVSRTSAAPAPLRVTRAAAGRLLRDLVPMTGFHASRFCLNATDEGCTLPSRPRWSQYVEWSGKRYVTGIPAPIMTSSWSPCSRTPAWRTLQRWSAT